MDDADYIQVRSLGVQFYVLRDRTPDKRGLYLIDCGFINGLRGQHSLYKAIQKAGWEKEKILGILVTHGHLDHVLNVAKLAEAKGAWIYAPRLDLAHYKGAANYTGWAKITGLLESLGKPLLGFKPFTPDRLLDDGDEIEIWHGLRTIHLPGHTRGHCGFYCEKLQLLFSADLFASYQNFTHLPSEFFNDNSREIPTSIEKALALDLKGVLPNHGDCASPAVHLKRLKKLFETLRKGSLY
ncbi:MBL fold metallo-hydrolase [Akkermansiaceae bacterium]|nr:MBL fold metallo-hydrolase [Akkermansiaceae bacterium]